MIDKKLWDVEGLSSFLVLKGGINKVIPKLHCLRRRREGHTQRKTKKQNQIL